TSSGPKHQQHDETSLPGKQKHGRAGEVSGKTVLSESLALVILIERDQSVSGSQHVDGELKIVFELDAAVRYDVGIGEYRNPARSVREIDQQCAFIVEKMHHRRCGPCRCRRRWNLVFTRFLCVLSLSAGR